MNQRSRVGIMVIFILMGMLLGDAQPVSAIAQQTTSSSLRTAVSGVVYDGGVNGGESHGYPLYASLTFTAPGFSQTVYSDPFTGAYVIDLVSEKTYQVTVSAVPRGYIDTQSDLVVQGGSPLNRDFYLNVDQDLCQAPGYSGGAFFEDFESGHLPEGWVNVDYAGTGEVWEFLSDPPNKNETPGEGGFAILDSFTYQNTVVNQNTGLWTPVLDFTAASSVILHFDTDFIAFEDASAVVRVSGNNGNSWTTRQSWTTDVRNSSVSLDITSQAAGKAQVIVEFRYIGDPNNPWGDWWQVDNVRIQAGDCSLVPGGVVAGFVQDANTGDPLVGADVVSPNLAVRSFAIDDDPENAGLYWAFQPAATDPTPVTFTASLENFVSDTKSVAVRPDRVTRQDFNLGTGYLTFEPDGFDVTMNMGDSPIGRTLTLNNTGALPVDFDLEVVNKPFPMTPAYAISYPGEHLVYMPDSASPGSWIPIGSLNVPIEDRNFIAGDFVGGDFSTLYVIDNFTGSLFTLNTATAALTEIGTAAAVGEWTGLSGTSGGVLYGISTNCSTFSNLYTINVGTAAATNLGGLPGIRCGNDLAYDPVEGFIYIIDSYAYQLFRVDPLTLEIEMIGDLGFNSKQFQGLDYEEHSGNLYWAANDFGSGQNELRVIDTMTGTSELLGIFPDSERVPVLAFATSGSQEWLRLTPNVGTLSPGSAVNVTLTIDPGALGHPGIYQAEVIILHDTIYEYDRIPVTLTLETVPAVPITSVAVSDITPPVALEMPDSSAIISADPSEGIGTHTVMVVWSPNDLPFGYNRVYTASVTLAPAAGYAFTGETTATVNGEAANVTKNANGTLTVYFAFPRTEPGEGGENMIFLPLILR